MKFKAIIFCDVLLFLLSYTVFGMEQNESIDEKLMLAARNGDKAEVEKLLEMGANVNAESKLPDFDKYTTITLIKNSFYCKRVPALHSAILNGHFEIAELLIEKGANVNLALPHYYDVTPIKVAIITGHNNFYNLLIINGADVNKLENNNERNLIHLAINENNTDGLEPIIKKMENLNTTNCIGKSALVEATKKHNLKLVELLLQYGADPSLLEKGDGFKASPLMWAANIGNQQMCELILTSITNIDAKKIRENFIGLLSIYRMYIKERICGLIVDHCNAPVIHEGPDELKIVRFLITKKIVESYINAYMQRALFLMGQMNRNLHTAQKIASINGFSQLAILLDPQNNESLNQISRLLEKKIHFILFP